MHWLSNLCESDTARSVFSFLAAGVVGYVTWEVSRRYFRESLDDIDYMQRAKEIEAEQHYLTAPDEDPNSARSDRMPFLKDDDQGSLLIDLIAIRYFMHENDLQEGDEPSRPQLLRLIQLASQLGELQRTREVHTKERRGMALFSHNINSANKSPQFYTDLGDFIRKIREQQEETQRILAENYGKISLALDLDEKEFRRSVDSIPIGDTKKLEIKNAKKPPGINELKAQRLLREFKNKKEKMVDPVRQVLAHLQANQSAMDETLQVSSDQNRAEAATIAGIYAEDQVLGRHKITEIQLCKLLGVVR